ncbi:MULTISPECIES: hypothetical protein [Sphingomonadales]|uniref:EamA domain-containing protein n=1 Tax=Novosphingobium lindaniclasticum LE124 TaxID=1096930 RepID=T0GZP3_9SPHN|nr:MULTISPECIES: hypothetical protein [Sphingomonadaceae]EQB09461.1 hypothetical protein L284_19660 [Novosphingobium lindaniclasticum LE124]MBT2245950.1 hypothetical protein [Sphingobium sp. BHU LFT2]
MSISLTSIFIFLAALITQISGAALIPRTAGFTDIGWTATCLASYIASTWLLAILVRQGVALNIVVPFMAAAVPLSTIAIAYLAYGQSVSLPKLGLLVGACCAIGIAGSLK